MRPMQSFEGKTSVLLQGKLVYLFSGELVRHFRNEKKTSVLVQQRACSPLKKRENWAAKTSGTLLGKGKKYLAIYFLLISPPYYDTVTNYRDS